MSKTDDLANLMEEGYEAEDLIRMLYPDPPEIDLNKLWARFNTSPRMALFKTEGVKQAIINGNCFHIIRRYRLSFFPKLEEGAAERQIFFAINQGIKSLNSLSEEHMTDLHLDFHIDEIREPFSLFDFLRRGREQWIEARDTGNGSVDPYLLHSAYKKSRSIDLGMRILQINSDPMGLSSVRNYVSCLDWFKNLLNFSEKEEANVAGHYNYWNTDAGIRLYGDKTPMRSRVKVLNSDGSLKYSSLLMKLCLEEDGYLDSIDDLTGVEFIVEDNKSRQALIHYITEVTPTKRVVGYKDRSKMRINNPNSSRKFTNVSFNLHVPVPQGYIGMGETVEGYARIPLEVQVLTLEEDEIRNKDPSASHDSYKGRTFRKLFPAWFPRQIYEPLIRDQYLK